MAKILLACGPTTLSPSWLIFFSRLSPSPPPHFSPYQPPENHKNKKIFALQTKDLHHNHLKFPQKHRRKHGFSPYIWRDIFFLSPSNQQHEGRKKWLCYLTNRNNNQPYPLTSPQKWLRLVIGPKRKACPALST